MGNNLPDGSQVPSSTERIEKQFLLIPCYPERLPNCIRQNEVKTDDGCCNFEGGTTEKSVPIG